MTAEILAILVRATIALSAALLLILALRRPVRAAFGAEIAYGLWALAPIVTLASFLPARRILIEAPPQGAAARADAMLGAPTPELAQTAAAIDVVTPLLVGVWATGVTFALLLLLVGQHRFLANANQAGPAVVGVLRPRIVLPKDFQERYTPLERDLVVAHERAHIAAFDAQINALAAFVQCLMWFNPLAHAARAALRVDQELACDARVLRNRAQDRRAYAEAMLKTQLAAQAVPLGCQWPPSGAKPLKQRIAMLAAPAPKTLRRAAGASLCALAMVGAGVLAWTLQPPQFAYAQTEPSRTEANALGRQLVNALLEGDMVAARALIDRGADVNAYVRGDGTPLVIAARFGDEALARYLIERGANVNQEAPGDGNPLIMASAFGHLGMVDLLLQAGAEVNSIVVGDETPLINAARSNRLEVARHLIANGADVNLAVMAPTVTGVERRSPLSEARRRSHAGMIALLRQHGAQT